MIDASVDKVINSWPLVSQEAVLCVREWIFEIANDEQLGRIDETLKWGEPAYLATHGSTIRIAWKKKTPDQLFIFFNCNSTLVETFRELYSYDLVFDGNRAIVLDLNTEANTVVIKHCLSMALNYHKLKKLPLLGD